MEQQFPNNAASKPDGRGKGDKIAELGGNLCWCCSTPNLCYVCCCQPCAFSKAVQDADIGLKGNAEMLIACDNNAQAFRANQVNMKLGGEDNLPHFWLRFCCPCTASCAVCQFVRAVENAKKSGLLVGGGGGAPRQYEGMILSVNGPQQQQPAYHQTVPFASSAGGVVLQSPPAPQYYQVV